MHITPYQGPVSMRIPARETGTEPHQLLRGRVIHATPSGKAIVAFGRFTALTEQSGPFRPGDILAVRLEGMPSHLGDRFPGVPLNNSGNDAASETTIWFRLLGGSRLHSGFSPGKPASPSSSGTPSEREGTRQQIAGQKIPDANGMAREQMGGHRAVTSRNGMAKLFHHLVDGITERLSGRLDSLVSGPDLRRSDTEASFLDTAGHRSGGTKGMPSPVVYWVVAENGSSSPVLMEMRKADDSKTDKQGSGSDAYRSLSLFVVLENTGGIDMTISQTSQGINVSFCVECDRIAKAFTSRMHELQAALDGTATVVADVRVSPETIAARIDSFSGAFQLDVSI